MADTLETYRTVTPYLVVADAEAELKFLREAFGGVEQLCHRNPDGRVMHAEVRVGDSLIMLGQAGEQWKPRPAALYLWIADVDAVYARALGAGASSESAPEDKPYGHRNAGVVAVSLATGLLFGAAPAWFATRTSPLEALRGAGRSTSDHSSLARRALLIVQAALSVVLVAGATMLARSLDRLQNQQFGYPIDGRVLVSLNRPPASYTLPQLASLYRKIEDGLNRLPGVHGAGLALYNPLTNNWGELILVSGHPVPTMGSGAGASWDRVSADYLQHLGVSLARGRFFDRRDNETAENVAIVNEAFVKRFFKSSEDPLGQHFGLNVPENAGTFRIAGIVHDAKFAGFALRSPARPMFYVPLAQAVAYRDPLMTRVEAQSHFIGGLLLKTTLSAGAVEPVVRRTLAGIDPNLTVNSVRSLREQVELTFDQERAVASLAGLFGLVALILAAVGLYGVTSYTVARRTNEIGIRMALGAGRGEVVRYILGGALGNVVAGLALAVGAARLIANQLYEVPFWDPLALALAAGALALCAGAAAMIPAGMAASISPMTALRTE